VACDAFTLMSLPARHSEKARASLYGAQRRGQAHDLSLFQDQEEARSTHEPSGQAPRLEDPRPPRTAASGMARLGTSPHIIEKVLNHISGVNSGLTAVYQRYEYQNERKEALEAWGSHVKELTWPRSGDSDTQEILKLISSQLPSL